MATHYRETIAGYTKEGRNTVNLYILEYNFDSISYGNVYCYSGKNIFICRDTANACRIIEIKKIKKEKIVKPKDLYRIEDEEFMEKSSKIMKEEGFRPTPLLSHNILKIYLLRESQSMICEL